MLKIRQRLFGAPKRMENNVLKIALLEIGNSHEECLLTQMVALKSAGAHLTFICTQEMKDRNPHFAPYIDVFEIIAFTHTALGDFKLMRRVNRYMETNQIRKAILNTAQGGHIRNLCLKSTQVEYIGIIHTIRKFQGSFTQKVISRKVRKYFVLSDLLLGKITLPKGIRIRSFYPLIHPHFGQPLEKDPSETWITLVGGVENRKKDLAGFADLVLQVKDQSVRFIFLGKSDPSSTEILAFKQQLAERGLSGKVVFFDTFISPERFDAYLAHTDFILPLIHPGTASAEQNISCQISGAFNLAFGYRIPLLMHRAYADLTDFKLASCFYEIRDFRESLAQALEQRINVAQQIATVPKWQVDYQQQQFLDFVLDR